MNLLAEQRQTTIRGAARPLLARLRVQLVLGVLICVVLPVIVRYGGVPGPMRAGSLQYGTFGALIAFLAAFYLYRQMGSFPGVQEGAHIIFCVTLTFGIMAAVFLLLRLDYSRFVLFSSFGITLVWLLGLQFALKRITTRSIAVVPGGHADALPEIGGANWQVLEAPPSETGWLGAVAADLRHDLSDAWEAFIAHCALNGIPVYHSKQISESLTGKVEIEHLSENQFGTLVPNSAYVDIKMMLDWVFALLLLPLFLVLFVIVAPLIVMTSGWPVFYTQKRVGYRGRIFRVYKFRTMAPADTKEPGNRDKAVTRENDRRITAIGQFLRRYRIDELPQIFNILKGEMSWIGPRPEAVTLSKWYEEELAFYPYRHVVRPGISGWAQVNQGHVAEPHEVMEKLHYDFFYIKYFSLWLDLVIGLRTIRAILTGFGAR